MIQRFPMGFFSQTSVSYRSKDRQCQNRLSMLNNVDQPKVGHEDDRENPAYAVQTAIFVQQRQIIEELLIPPDMSL